MLAPKFDFVGQFNPRQLAGLALWFDAADAGTLFQNQGGTTPVTAAGQPIFRWNDKSGNGRNATTPRVVSRVDMTNPGSGYTLPPTVTITAAGVDIGNGAQATATISGGEVSALTLTARGSQYGQTPNVTITPAAGDTTGTGATATATTTSFPTRSLTPAGVVFNTLNAGGASTPSGPYMALPALAIPASHTVFSVFTRVDSQFSLPIGSGLDAAPTSSPQGSRYAINMFTDNVVYVASVSQANFTTHQPRQGFGGEVVILRSVRTAGTSVDTRINDMPVSSVTSGNGVTQNASGSWGALGADAASGNAPLSGNQILRIHRGLLHEVIVYDRALTAAEQATVTEYLRAKWSVIFGSRFNLDWKVVGASAWPGYRWSMSNTISTATVANTQVTPPGIYYGACDRITVTNGGSGYTAGATVTISGNATATATVVGGVVTAINITSTGNGYLSPPTVTITGVSGGSGATATASVTPANSHAGAVLLQDGRVFCVPDSSTTARIYDPATNTTVIPAGTYPGGRAFIGGVLLPDGRVFCVPFNATAASIYDPATDTVSTPAATFPGNGAFAGGVLLPDGRVFCVPYNHNTAFLFDPGSGIASSTGTFAGGGQLIAGALLPDGKVFCVPFIATQARIYDPVTNTHTTTAAGSFPGGGLLYGATLLPDDRLFIGPYSSTTGRFYNPATGAVTSTGASMFPSGGGRFLGRVLLPDGRVFVVPHNNTSARIYNPTNDTVSQPAGTNPGVASFHNGVLMADGRVFCVPAQSTTAAIYGGGGGFNVNVALSSYHNRV